MIGAFDQDGRLPPGIHRTEWKEFCERFGYNIYRKRLIRGMKDAFDNLKVAGCKMVYVDGSFVTSKNKPNDYDACWKEEGVDPNLLDSVLKDFSNGRKAQKMKYRGELFPAAMITATSGEIFLDFFQTDRNSDGKKGIIEINLEDFCNDKE